MSITSISRHFYRASAYPLSICLALFFCTSQLLAADLAAPAAAKPATVVVAQPAPASGEPRELDDVAADDKIAAKEQEKPDDNLDPNKKRDDAQFEVQEWSVW